MRYDDDDRKSSNVDDRRGRGGGFSFPGFGRGRPGRGVRVPMGGKGGMSLTSLLIIGGIMLLLGINPLEMLMGGGGSGGGFNLPEMPKSERQVTRRTTSEIPGLPGSRREQGQSTGTDAKDAGAVFVSRVLADTEDVWNRVFATFNKDYREPRLTLFTGSVPTACGQGVSAAGPFYCPADEKIYIDLAFFDELQRRFKAPGDFAQAYVIAHEVGHHIQKQLGIADKVQSMKRRMSKKQANALQVRMELQADCLAGVWANINNQLKNRLEPGDIDEGLNAASQIGDDMIQRRTQGYVVPDAFTHGSAAQRTRWFKKGYQAGKMQVCDTFGTDDV
ncbi:MAG: KPN_02809 family neutral zinc metallopeptidase [Hyphomicrobiaceae bacterium]